MRYSLSVWILSTALACGALLPASAAEDGSTVAAGKEKEKVYGQLRPRIRGVARQTPGLWDLNTADSRQNIFCYHHSTGMRLWREDKRRPMLLSLSMQDSSEEITLSWPAGQALLDWPHNQLPLHDGAMAFMSLHDAPPRLIILRQLPADFVQQPATEQLPRLQQQECRGQSQWLESRLAGGDIENTK